MPAGFSMQIKQDFARYAASLDDSAAKHLPFAVSRALTDTAKSTAARMTAEIPAIFGKATPFTRHAMGFTGASRGKPEATVFVRNIQAHYLLREELGGARTAAENTIKPGQSLLLPGKTLPLNSYGNIPLGAIARLRKLAAQDKQDRRRKSAGVAFDGAVKGKKLAARLATINRNTGVVFLQADEVPAPFQKIGGYFMRADGHHLRRLTVFEAETHYQPKFKFRQHFDEFASRDFLHNLSVRFREALTQGGVYR
ncbi:MAG: hypothetical protein ACRYGR_01210 [Janthinobacterium lividum]